MQVSKEEEMVKGRVMRVDTLRIEGKAIIFAGRTFKLARIKEEWYDDVENPELMIKSLREAKPRPDILTFWQRLPEIIPKYNYYMEWDSIAALPIIGYEHWFKKQIDTNARRAIRKAEKNGVEVKAVKFDDEFINGMINIFNETPIRQGRPFWHYGKDFETVKRQFARYLYREDLIGAYHNGELIGFIMLGHAGKYAELGQIISKIGHRDKCPNNALMAKAVEMCQKKEIPYLTYGLWKRGNWSEFPRRNGFEKVDLPRYYVPLSIRGEIILKLGLHRGIKGVLPDKVLGGLLHLRKQYWTWKYGGRAIQT